MKKILKLTAMIMVVVLSLTVLVACSDKYPAIKKAFEDEGYSESTQVEALASSLKTALERDDFEINVHILTKITLTGGIRTAIVIEFKETDELKNAIAENETLKNALMEFVSSQDVQDYYAELEEAGYANGNCLLVPVVFSADALEEVVSIFKNA